ncbi:Adrenodoxin [Schistosoma japonicum]|nr:Adrenodoxin [Schistosoma japonicum]
MNDVVISVPELTTPSLTRPDYYEISPLRHPINPGKLNYVKFLFAFLSTIYLKLTCYFNSTVKQSFVHYPIKRISGGKLSSFPFCELYSLLPHSILHIIFNEFIIYMSVLTTSTVCITLFSFALMYTLLFYKLITLPGTNIPQFSASWWLTSNSDVFESHVAARLPKFIRPVLTKSLESSGRPNNGNDIQNEGNIKTQRVNKNLSKLKKYKKRQLKKRYSRKQLKARKSKVEEKKIKSISETQEEALKYLRIWHDDYENWKFKKLLQSWLIKNALDKKMLPHLEFRIFKRYIKKLAGLARQNLIDRCSKATDSQILDTKEPEICVGLADKEDLSSKHLVCQNNSEYSVSTKRAKKILAILSETSVQ